MVYGEVGLQGIWTDGQTNRVIAINLQTVWGMGDIGFCNYYIVNSKQFNKNIISLKDVTS